MSTEIEVAFVGRDVRQFLPRGSGIDPPYFDADENTRPWDDHQRVTLVVDDDERLVNIFDRAVEAAGVFEADWSKHRGEIGYGTWRHIALRDDDSPIPLIYRLTDRPMLVDDDGLAVWGQGLYGKTNYAQLRASAEAGAVPGDPTQIYLNVRLGPAGGEAFIEWELVIQAWEMAWCADSQLRLFGVCRFFFSYGIFPRCSLCPLFDAERAIRDVLGENLHPGAMLSIEISQAILARLRGEPFRDGTSRRLIRLRCRDSGHPLTAVKGGKGAPSTWTRT